MTDHSGEERTPLMINNDTAEIDLTGIFENDNERPRAPGGVFSNWFQARQATDSSASSGYLREAETEPSGARAPVMNRNTRSTRRDTPMWHGNDDSGIEEDDEDSRTSGFATIKRAFRNCLRCQGSCGRCFWFALGCMPCVQGCVVCGAILSLIFLRKYPYVIGLLCMGWLITVLAALILRLSFQPETSSEPTSNIVYSRRVGNAYQTRSGHRIPWRNIALMMNEGNFTDQDYERLLALDEDTPTQVLQRASGHDINRLPTYTYSAPQHKEQKDGGQTTGDEEDPEKELKRKCSICLAFFEDGEQLRILPCLHQFHSECIDPWLSQGKAECPVCKVDIRDQ